MLLSASQFCLYLTQRLSLTVVRCTVVSWGNGKEKDTVFDSLPAFEIFCSLPLTMPHWCEPGSCCRGLQWCVSADAPDTASGYKFDADPNSGPNISFSLSRLTWILLVVVNCEVLELGVGGVSCPNITNYVCYVLPLVWVWGVFNNQCLPNSEFSQPSSFYSIEYFSIAIGAPPSQLQGQGNYVPPPG
jgi:hypothetical protein